MWYNNYVLLGIIDLPVCGSIKLLSTILSLNNWTRQLWTLAELDPSSITIKKSHREDKYILYFTYDNTYYQNSIPILCRTECWTSSACSKFLFRWQANSNCSSMFFFFARNRPTFLKLWFIYSSFEIAAIFPFSLDWAQKTMFPLSSDLGWSYCIEFFFMGLLVCIGYDVIHYICLLQISGNHGW